MSAPTCKFIRESTGKACQGVALKGTDRCYHHQAEKERRDYLKVLRQKGGEPWVLEAFNLPPLDTIDDVQIALSALFLAVAHRRIMEEDAHLLLAILRVASRNLRVKLPKPAPPPPDPEAWRNLPESEMTSEQLGILFKEHYLDRFANKDGPVPAEKKPADEKKKVESPKS